MFSIRTLISAALVSVVVLKAAADSITVYELTDPCGELPALQPAPLADYSLNLIIRRRWLRRRRSDLPDVHRHLCGHE